MDLLKPAIQEGQDFLASHFQSAHAELGSSFFLELRAIRKPNEIRPLFFTFEDISRDISEVIKLNMEGFDIYFGVNPRPLSKRKKEADIEHLICFWTDIDIGPTRFYKSRDGALGDICHFRIRPDTIVDSGGGFHCYWHLEHPFHLGDLEKRNNARSILSGLIKSTHADPSGISLESVLRLPGTINHKYGRKCRILEQIDEQES